MQEAKTHHVPFSIKPLAGHSKSSMANRYMHAVRNQLTTIELGLSDFQMQTVSFACVMCKRTTQASSGMEYMWAMVGLVMYGRWCLGMIVTLASFVR